MKALYFLALLIQALMWFTPQAIAQLSPKVEQKLQELEKEYANRNAYNQQREDQLKQLRIQEQKYWEAQRYTSCFEVQRQLLDLLLAYKGKEALRQANALMKTAEALENQQRIYEATLKKAEVLLSLGVFIKAKELLQAIPSHQLLDQELRVDYYFLQYRLNYDLAEYTQLKEFYKDYQQTGGIYADSVLMLAKDGSFIASLVKAVEYSRHGKNQEAVAIYDRVIEENKASFHQLAMTHASKGWVQATKEAQILELLQSAIYDIKSSTYETTANHLLAVYFMDIGELELADRFMQRALENARIYGARQRIAQINILWPVIEAQIKDMEEKRQLFWKVSFFVLFSLSVLLLLQTFRLKKRNQKVRTAQSQMTEKNKELEQNYQRIRESQDLLNQQHGELQQVNEQLRKANALREGYVKQFFEIGAQFFEQLDHFHQTVGGLLVQKKYSKIEALITQYKPKKQRDLFYRNFDELFLDLYPTFIQDLERITGNTGTFNVEGEKKLTPELRVFALMRLGINDTDRVANILGLTKNTIYAYRNRVRAKVPSSTEDFEQQLMEISSI
ncbi:DUF6377 domain-containing protein [Algivirga pacifica]|uniref:DUF6377 domain-containing protein n=1 Tax=Algivirga pacifica TaxID=1162670 RepID=A0ABP9DDV1_9BACT